MHPSKVRQGVTAGLVVLFVLAVTLSSQSSSPLETFAETAAFGLVAVLLVALGAVSYNRHAGPLGPS